MIMALFHFGQKKKTFKKTPQTFEEWTDFMLTQTDDTKAGEAVHTLTQMCWHMPIAQSLPCMAWLANRTVETAQSDSNRQRALEVLTQVLNRPTYAPGCSGPDHYMDAALMYWEETEAVEKAVLNLFQSGGSMVHDAIRNIACDGNCSRPAGVNTIDPAFLRPIYAETLEDASCRRRYVNDRPSWHFDPLNEGYKADNDYIFPIFDFIVHHRDDMTPELVSELTDIFNKKLHGARDRRGSRVNKQNVPYLSDYFKTYYLRSLGREDDTALAEWFTETFCTEKAD